MKTIHAIVALSATLLWLGISVTVAAIPATLLTNTGRLAEGSLTGIGPVIRLLNPENVKLIGPAVQFDLPLSSIRQIAVDFPRLVVETENRTLIGPWTAFTGLAQELSLEIPNQGSLAIPLTAVRAIALNGGSLHPVPREWTGAGFLTEPEIRAATALRAAACDECTITPPSTSPIDQEYTDGQETVWNSIDPAIPLDDGSTGLPWWVGLLGVAGLFALFYLSGTG